MHELSKCMNEANMRHYKDILLAIKYVIYTKDYCYKIKLDKNTNEPWELHGYSDVDYARDNKTKKSMTGYIVLINRAVIAWCLRSQKTFTLSVTEVEYSPIIGVRCEILFIRAILLFMRVVVK